MILKAAALAKEIHQNQKRKYNGDPFILHPMRVAGRVTLLPGATKEMVAAAWLHDAIEESSAPMLDVMRAIHRSAGWDVLRLVLELTNTTKQLPIPLSRAERKKYDRERLMHVSLDAKIIKLVDRIDNVLDMKGAPEDFARLYLEESKLLASALGHAAPHLEGKLLEAIDKMGLECRKQAELTASREKEKAKKK